MRLASTVAAALLLLGLTACTSSPDDRPGAQPSTDASSSDPALAPITAAQEQLNTLHPAASKQVGRRGAGPLIEAFGNTLAGRPAADESAEFVFTCLGTGVVSLVIRDADVPIPGTAGEIACGDGTSFKKAFPVTTKSVLSFRGTSAGAKGGFAYAWIGDIR